MQSLLSMTDSNRPSLFVSHSVFDCFVWNKPETGELENRDWFVIPKPSIALNSTEQNDSRWVSCSEVSLQIKIESVVQEKQEEAETSK